MPSGGREAAPGVSTRGVMPVEELRAGSCGIIIIGLSLGQHVLKTAHSSNTLSP